MSGASAKREFGTGEKPITSHGKAPSGESANKVKGVRCALCADPWSAEMTRRHNDANVLAIGAGVTGPLLARQIVTAFLTHEFEGGRHQRRVDKVMSTEA